ncbi:hypothetical protein SDC9_108487 [bioreactor metagenome]|uniref:Uncharacterized protein n=1 Tax=bioreactor metagenome TaxID=1076179 RepID=A0A645B898_9ZZZZ
MASGHFVTHLDFAFFGHIYFGNLHNSRGKLVAYSQVETLALKLCIQFFELAQVIDDRCADQLVFVSVGCPLAQLNRLVIDIRKNLQGEFSSFGNNIHIGVILHAGRRLAFGNVQEFIDKQLSQFFHLVLILFVEFGKKRFVRQLAFAFLSGFREQVRIDNHTLK